MMAITILRNKKKQLQRGARAVVWWSPYNKLQDNQFYVKFCPATRGLSCIVAIILDAGFKKNKYFFSSVLPPFVRFAVKLLFATIGGIAQL